MLNLEVANLEELKFPSKLFLITNLADNKKKARLILALFKLIKTLFSSLKEESNKVVKLLKLLSLRSIMNKSKENSRMFINF